MNLKKDVNHDERGIIMALSAKVSEKGQVTVPQALRKRAGIKAGDELLFVLTADNRIYVEVMPHMASAEDSFGILSRPNQKPLDMTEARVALRQSRADRHVPFSPFPS